jgi:hypothetical protein
MGDGTCPKCNGAMEDGGASCSRGYFLYKSDRQGSREATTPIAKARVCLQCGYVELYLDPAKLGENLEGKTKGPRLW